MAYEISFTTYTGSTTSVTVESPPTSCPLCHWAIDPRRHGGAALDTTQQRIDAVFQCPRPECRRIFIGRYRRSDAVSTYRLDSLAPREPQTPSVPTEVADVSPAFVEVYAQALAGESAGLNQITGMGLRKALEFLIKDFAIHQHPGKDDEIKRTPLSKCIDKYVADPNVKVTATRATWLGNDETHYVRRWEDRDIRDLKLLIRLTANWVENVLLTEKYQQEMPG